MQIERGEMVAVIGRVGSGKSSLVSAMLGEMVSDAKIVDDSDASSSDEDDRDSLPGGDSVHEEGLSEDFTGFVGGFHNLSEDFTVCRRISRDLSEDFTVCRRISRLFTLSMRLLFRSPQCY